MEQKRLAVTPQQMIEPMRTLRELMEGVPADFVFNMDNHCRRCNPFLSR
jgi:hypothetical protein